MINDSKHLTIFKWDKDLDSSRLNDTTKPKNEYLQITVLNDLGKLDGTIKQKIVRLNEEEQLELFDMLLQKYRNKK